MTTALDVFSLPGHLSQRAFSLTLLGGEEEILKLEPLKFSGALGFQIFGVETHGQSCLEMSIYTLH